MLKSAFKRFKNPIQIIPRFLQSKNLSTQFDKIPKEAADCVVIGAGIVGIAIARALALEGRDVLVIESASTFGTGTSSRNSEVIHAGIYYPPKSLKAVLCVRGRELLYNYCSDRGVLHEQIGKLIVATGSTESPKLRNLLERGTENGVQGLRMMDGFDAMRMEPELQCVKALLSPCSGIVDSHSAMLSLIFPEQDCGARLGFGAVRFISANTNMTWMGHTELVGNFKGERITVEQPSPITLPLSAATSKKIIFISNVSESKDLEKCDEKSPLQPQLILIPNLVIKSMGLGAMSLARRLRGQPPAVIPSSYYARGCYFTLSKTRIPPFRHLIYPIPEDGGLGVHVTLDLDGQVKFGPDVEWIDGVDDVSAFLNRFDYSVNTNGAERFYLEIRKYYPNLTDGSLEPGYAGIRPKLSGPGQPPADFVIQGEDIHAMPGLVSLFGIESPGLTSSMAIAEYIVLNFLR